MEFFFWLCFSGHAGFVLVCTNAVEFKFWNAFRHACFHVPLCCSYKHCTGILLLVYFKHSSLQPYFVALWKTCSYIYLPWCLLFFFNFFFFCLQSITHFHNSFHYDLLSITLIFMAHLKNSLRHSYLQSYAVCTINHFVIWLLWLNLFCPAFLFLFFFFFFFFSSVLNCTKRSWRLSVST